MVASTNIRRKKNLYIRHCVSCVRIYWMSSAQSFSRKPSTTWTTHCKYHPNFNSVSKFHHLLWANGRWMKFPFVSKTTISHHITLVLNACTVSISFMFERFISQNQKIHRDENVFAWFGCCCCWCFFFSRHSHLWRVCDMCFESEKFEWFSAFMEEFTVNASNCLNSRHMLELSIFQT